MLFFDIGANIGRWAIANQSNNEVVCIEASPSTYHTLLRETQQYPNITCLSYAVSPSTEPEVKLYEASANTLTTLDSSWLTNPASRFYGEYHITQCIDVPVISIDKLIDMYGVPDILKIDVEGAENIVLKSLTQKAKTVCFEWASEWKTQARECIDHVVSLGYTKFYLQYSDDYVFRPTEYNHTAETLWEEFQKTTPKIHWGMIWCN